MPEVIRRIWSRVRVPVPRKRRDGWHWFDHPEMQARIREVEEERRAGRTKRFESREDALEYIRSLGR